MNEEWAATAGAVLRALADLAPSAEQAAAGLARELVRSGLPAQ